MGKFYVVCVKTSLDETVVETVLNDVDDTVYITDSEYFELPCSEWRKASHFLNWVKNNRPDWKVLFKSFHTRILIDMV